MTFPEAPLSARLPTAILDANGVIGLAKAGCLPLVQHIFSPAFVPSLVVAEVTDTLSQAELAAALEEWLVEATPSAGALLSVSTMSREADRHVLALALDHRPCYLITGDRGLVSRARQAQVDTVSAPRVVQLLAERGLVEAARPYLDRMMDRGFGIRQDVYAEILRDLGE